MQNLGLAGEYQLSRKLYFASLVGFGHLPVAGATADDGTAGLVLAKFESIAANIKPILNQFSFFGLGPQVNTGSNINGPLGGAADEPICEDFNEQVVCNPTPTTASTLPANVNGCAGNPSGIPGGPGETTLFTVCGDGHKDAFEECDNGTSNGTTGNNCSQTCRCVHDFNNALNAGLGGCNP